jgi:hypothetical protein
LYSLNQTCRDLHGDITAYIRNPNNKEEVVRRFDQYVLLKKPPQNNHNKGNRFVPLDEFVSLEDDLEVVKVFGVEKTLRSRPERFLDFIQKSALPYVSKPINELQTYYNHVLNIDAMIGRSHKAYDDDDNDDDNDDDDEGRRALSSAESYQLTDMMLRRAIWHLTCRGVLMKVQTHNPYVPEFPVWDQVGLLMTRCISKDTFSLVEARAGREGKEAIFQEVLDDMVFWEAVESRFFYPLSRRMEPFKFCEVYTTRRPWSCVDGELDPRVSASADIAFGFYQLCSHALPYALPDLWSAKRNRCSELISRHMTKKDIRFLLDGMRSSYRFQAGYRSNFAIMNFGKTLLVNNQVTIVLQCTPLDEKNRREGKEREFEPFDIHESNKPSLHSWLFS